MARTASSVPFPLVQLQLRIRCFWNSSILHRYLHSLVWHQPLVRNSDLGNSCVYLLLYTPLKKRSPYATEIGAVSGALLIGWVAAEGLPQLTDGSRSVFFYLAASSFHGHRMEFQR